MKKMNLAIVIAILLGSVVVAVQLFLLNKAVITSVAVTPDGKGVVMGCNDGNAYVGWNLYTRESLQILRGHTGGVTSVAITPDGKKVVTGSKDKTARVWDINTGQELQILWGHEGGVTSVAITPDGKNVVTGSTDGTVSIWDIDAGSRLTGGVAASTRISAYTGALSKGGVTSVAITPDGKGLWTGYTDGSVTFRDIEI